MTIRGFTQLTSNMQKYDANIVSKNLFRYGSKAGEYVEIDLGTYVQDLKQAVTPKEKIRAIITLVQDMKLIHPFTNCNTRTLCSLILNRELIKNGFPPLILDNFHKLDGYSTDECIIEIIKGLENFRNAVENIEQVEEFEYAMEEFSSPSKDESYYIPCEEQTKQHLSGVANARRNYLLYFSCSGAAISIIAISVLAYLYTTTKEFESNKLGLYGLLASCVIALIFIEISIYAAVYKNEPSTKVTNSEIKLSKNIDLQHAV